MLVSELVALTRELYLDDTVEPYLWSDDILSSLALQAEREACMRADLLIKTDGYSIITYPDTPVYSISESIIKIISMSIAEKRFSTPVTRKALAEIGYLNTKGKPLYYSFIDDYSIRLNPIPDKEYVLTLTVSVLPTTTEFTEFQIPNEFQKYLAYYVASNALLSSDVDATDNSMALEFGELFTQKFGEPKNAKAIKREKFYSNDASVGSSAKMFGFK